MLSHGVLLIHPRTLSADFKLWSFIVCYYFVQKSLPLLEEQIRVSLQTATEELRQCGENIPTSDTDVMFFLIEVRISGASTWPLRHQIP